MSLSATPLPVGVEVRGVDATRPIPDDVRRALYDLFIQHGVLLFRDAGESAEAHTRIAECFGELERHSIKESWVEGNPHLIDISYVPPPSGTQSVTQPGVAGTTLYHPGGLGIDNFTIAAPQLEIGSIFGTRAVVRWIDLNLGKSDFGKIKLVGGGLQHSLSQYLPPGFPVKLAVGAFYQELKISDKLLDAKTFHADVTGSRHFGVLQPYVGVGYDSFKLDVDYASKTSDPGQDISIKFDKQNNAHLTAGLEANLLFLKLHGEVNVAAETGYAVGLRFGK